MYNTFKHGPAETYSYRQLNTSEMKALSGLEGSDSISLSSQIFSRLVTPIETYYSSIIVTNGNDVYTMLTQSGMGSTSGNSVWQVMKTSTNGNYVTNLYANGSPSFTNAASAYLNLNYKI